MMSLTSCPSAERLAAYRQHQLTDSEQTELASHVATCAACQQALKELETNPSVRTATVGDAKRELRDDKAPNTTSGPTVRLSGPPTPMASEAAPRGLGQIGQYQLLAVLGRGGMGTVYRATHSKLKKSVAIKLLPAHEAHDPVAIARFHREMEAVGKLDHPNIVRATDAGETNDAYYLVMELVRGEDLSKLVRRIGRLRVADACELIRQAAIGLQHAHEHGLVHRDIKPSNLMLSAEGRVKILDMGLARLHGEQRPEGELTATGAIMGTADYMAPEQGADTHSVDIRADLYSLGCSLYHLVAGKPPFTGPKFDTLLKKMNAHAEAAVPSLQDSVADVPVELLAILDRLLAKNPGQRFASPGDLARALKPLAAGCDLPALVASRPKNETDAAGPGSSTDDARAAVTYETGLGQAQPSPSASRSRTTEKLVALGTTRRRMIAVGAALVLVVAAFSVHWRRGATTPTGGPGLPPDPSAALALQMMPGMNGQWWFDETPWLAPSVRNQLLGDLSPDERASLFRPAGGNADSNAASLNGDIRTLYARLAELTQRYVSLRPYNEVEHLQSLLVLGNVGQEELPNELKKLSAALRAKADLGSTDYHLLGVLAHKVRDWGSAKEAYSKAIGQYEAKRPAENGLYALCLADFGRMQFEAGDSVAAVGLFRRARETAGEAASPFLTVDVFCNECNAQRRLGNLQDAEKCLTSAAAIAEKRIGNDHPLVAHLHERFAWFYLDSWAIRKSIEQFQLARDQRESSARSGNPVAQVFAFHDRHGEAMARRFSGDLAAARKGYDRLIVDIESAAQAAGASAKDRRDLALRLLNTRERRADCDLFDDAAEQAAEKYEMASRFGEQEDLFVSNSVPEAARIRFKQAIASAIAKKPADARKAMAEGEKRMDLLADGHKRELQPLREAALGLVLLTDGDVSKAARQVRDHVQSQFETRRSKLTRDDLDLLLLAMRMTLRVATKLDQKELAASVDLAVRLARLPTRATPSDEVLRYLRPVFDRAIEATLDSAMPDPSLAAELAAEAHFAAQRVTFPADQIVVVLHLAAERGWAIVMTPGKPARHLPLGFGLDDIISATTVQKPHLPVELKELLASKHPVSVCWHDPVNGLDEKNFPVEKSPQLRFLTPQP